MYRNTNEKYNFSCKYLCCKILDSFLSEYQHAFTYVNACILIETVRGKVTFPLFNFHVCKKRRPWTEAIIVTRLFGSWPEHGNKAIWYRGGEGGRGRGEGRGGEGGAIGKEEHRRGGREGRRDSEGGSRSGRKHRQKSISSIGLSAGTGWHKHAQE